MSMLLQMAGIPSFSQLSNIPLGIDSKAQCLQSHVVTKTHTRLGDWTITNAHFASWLVWTRPQWTWVQVSLLHPDFNSFVYIPRRGIAEKQSSSVFNFWRKHHTLLFVSGSALAIAANPWVFISVLLPLRHTWSNRQVCPWNTEWSRQRLTEFWRENTLVTADTLFQQQKRRLYTWASPGDQYQNQSDYILCSQRWRSPIQPAKTRPGADYGSDHELFISKIRLKLKKVGKTTTPFRYDFNQTPYNYTMEVTNRFIDSRDWIW